MDAPANLINTLDLPDVPFQVRYGNDKMIAFVNLAEDAEDGLDPSASFVKLLGALQNTELKGIDAEGLQAAMPNIIAGEPFCIVRGKAPVDGKNGYIKYTFETNTAERLWRLDEGQKVDFHERNEINNVSAGDLLAELVAPTEPQDGRDIFGNPLAAKKGRTVRLSGGKGVRLNEEKTKAYAETDGSVKVAKSRLAVDPTWIIQGDVDFHTGNINFNGDVIVKGDVHESFSVTAAGNIAVAGVVDHAALTAGGDITIDSGLYGKEGVEIKADGNISFVFAENANLRAGGSIYAKRAMINCTAFADGMIHLKVAGKALIGGHIIGNHGVEANSLGNPMIATRTIVEFGLRPEIPKRIWKIRKDLPEAEKEEAAKLAEELEELMEEGKRQMAARVVARDVTYPGVVLMSGGISFEVKSEISRMIFYKLHGTKEISMRRYESDRAQRE